MNFDFRMTLKLLRSIQTLISFSSVEGPILQRKNHYKIQPASF